jgi:type VI secretion system protein ImpC
MSEANRIGLLWPRFLLRLPYGRRTTPIEAFAYEETAEAWQHDDYLWGNPAYLFGVLLGNAFSQSGWRLRPGEASEVRGLPQHIRDVDGEPEANPSGELLLNERAVARVVARGVMPVVSVRGEDVVRLTSVRAVNGEPLCGRWPAR